MKKSVLLRRFLSIATAFALLASACSMMLTVSADVSGDGIYPLLQGSVGWYNETHLSVDTNIKNVAEGLNLYKVSTITDNQEANIWLNCKSPDQAGFDSSEIKSVAHYFKNDAGKQLTINLQNFTDGYNADNVWVTAFGRLMNCAVYLVPSDGDVVKAAVSGNDGLVTIPQSFEGYVVYDTDTRSTTQSGNVYDLLTSEYTFGSAMAFTVPKDTLKCGDAFYYGDLCASTGTAKDFILRLNSNAVYSYMLTTGLDWCAWGEGDNQTITNDYSDPYNIISTFEMPSGRNEWNFDQIAYKTKQITEYGATPSDITACSYYVKNPGGHGAIRLRLGKQSTEGWKFFEWFTWHLYDINTESITEYDDSNNGGVEIPEGFEGYIILDVRQYTDNFNYLNIFEEGVLWFHQGQELSVAGLEVSLGSVTAWSADYATVKQKIIEKSNTVSAPLSWGRNDEEVNNKLTVASDSEFGGYRYTVTNADSGYIGVSFDLNSKLNEGSKSSVFLSDRQAVAIRFKNTTNNSILADLHQDYPWKNFNTAVQLFDTAKNTVSELRSDINFRIPANFDGYIIFDLKNTMVFGEGEDQQPWIEKVTEITGPALNINTSDVGAGNSYFIGNKLSYVKDLETFVGAKLGSEELNGDANGDSTVDICDLVRLKNYTVGTAGSDIKISNLRYDGYGLLDTSNTLLKLREQLLNAAS